MNARTPLSQSSSGRRVLHDGGLPSASLLLLVGLENCGRNPVLLLADIQLVFFCTTRFERFCRKLQLVYEGGGGGAPCIAWIFLAPLCLLLSSLMNRPSFVLW